MSIRPDKLIFVLCWYHVITVWRKNVSSNVAQKLFKRDVVYILSVKYKIWSAAIFWRREGKVWSPYTVALTVYYLCFRENEYVHKLRIILIIRWTSTYWTHSSFITTLFRKWFNNSVSKQHLRNDVITFSSYSIYISFPRYYSSQSISADHRSSTE